MGVGIQREVLDVELADIFLRLVRIGKKKCREHKLPIKEISNRDINGIFIDWENRVPYYKISSWADKHMEEFLDSRPWLTPEVLDWLKTFHFLYGELEALWENNGRFLKWLHQQKGALAIYITLRGKEPDVGNAGFQRILNRYCYLMGENKLYEEYSGLQH